MTDVTVRKTVNELVQISNAIKSRYRLYQRHNEEYSEHEDIPNGFYDNDRGVYRSGEFALAPCKLINENLSKLVEVTLRTYTPENLACLLKKIRSEEFSEHLEILRTSAIAGEEQMEQDALEFVFKMVAKNQLDDNTIPTSESCRIRLLENLVVHSPVKLKSKFPDIYVEQPFLYFENYSELVTAELQLLKNLKNLKDKKFTFVGAGFPLTGIILHIKTGANISLVECDLEAVENAKKFIKIAEDLSIVVKDSIRLFHADARNVMFGDCKNSVENTDKIKVETDILDLASALSAETTKIIIQKNAYTVPIIRKRNVRGASEILYEPFDLKSADPCNFQFMAEVTPPQKLASGASPRKMVVGLTSPKNVNSCQLFLNTKYY